MSMLAVPSFNSHVWIRKYTVRWLTFAEILMFPSVHLLSFVVSVLYNLFTSLCVLTHEKHTHTHTRTHTRTQLLTQPELPVWILGFFLDKHCLTLHLFAFDILLMTTQGYDSLTHEPLVTFWGSSLNQIPFSSSFFPWFDRLELSW